jgi:hypothetical protein
MAHGENVRAALRMRDVRPSVSQQRSCTLPLMRAVYHHVTRYITGTLLKACTVSHFCCSSRAAHVQSQSESVHIAPRASLRTLLPCSTPSSACGT